MFVYGEFRCLFDVFDLFGFMIHYYAFMCFILFPAFWALIDWFDLLLWDNGYLWFSVCFIVDCLLWVSLGVCCFVV